MAKLSSLRPGVESFPDARSLTETKGYVPLEVRVKHMLAAGQSLVKAKADMFDFLQESDLDRMDPRVVMLRQPGIDLADMSEAMRESAKRKRAIRERLREANRAESARKSDSTGKVDASVEASKSGSPSYG